MQKEKGSSKKEKSDMNTSFKKIISEIWENELSSIFREPVKYKELGLVDYP